MHKPPTLLLARRALLAATVIGCIAYLLLAITPSSYAVGMQMLGQPVKGLIAGTPRPIRSDEWMVLTPYVQLAVKSHFAIHDLISPYHEDLKAFFALPLMDWAAIFKPYYVAFAILPPANAFSFFYLFNALAFILGWAWFFKLLRIDIKIAFGTALLLFFSQFVQVWWTSNSGAFALAPWAAIAWITLDRRWLRVALAGYALTAWLLADLYPPFIYSLGLAMIFAVLALRSDLLTIPRIIDAALATGIAVSITLAYYGGMIQTMEGTVYPGHRLSPGGGVELAKLAGQFYPFALTREYEPLSILTNTNACEVAVVGTLLPLFCLIFLDYGLLRKLTRENFRTFAILFTGITFCAAWIFFPIPAIVGKIFGLTFVPGNRLLLALGWLITIACMALMSACAAKLNGVRLAVGLLAMAAIIYFKHVWVGGDWNTSITYFDFTPLVALALLLPLCLRRASPRWLPIVVAAFCVNVVTFGLFNPVQSAYPIFSMNKAAIQQHLLASGAETTKSGALVIPGNWGVLVNGVGIPSFNHVLLYPQLQFFKAYFGQLPEDQFNNLFNRYEHVSFKPSGNPQLMQPDLVRLPMDRIIDPNTSTGAGQFQPWARVDLFEWRRTHDEQQGTVEIKGLSDGISGTNSAADQPIASNLDAGVTMTADEHGAFYSRMPSVDPTSALRNGGLPASIKSANSNGVTAMSMYGRIVPTQMIHDQLGLSTTSGVVDAVQVSRNSKHVSLRGWAATDGNAPLRFNIAAGARIDAFSIQRVDRPDVGRLVNPAYQNAGFDIVIDFEGPAKGTEVCVNVQGASAQYSNLTFPNQHLGCTTIR